ncbi:hypothetical protein B0T10DRAFT_49313 [Thelonectria olida]|uniref:F-box domain-containing protein n=1 Tax=Thelonectria olida TaxID=1576542 RepID=A0A9P8W3C1_9HYPO|nr:hypothetical protein B0T10DRAFT_49313 [Thelonectria olida]
MSDFDIATSQAGHKLLGLTNLINSIASKKPDDQQAQLRAHAAVQAQAACEVHAPIGFRHGAANILNPIENHGTKQFVSAEESNPSGWAKETLPPLPTELYELIISHVTSFDYEDRQRTLVALSSSCRAFLAIAEPYLYSIPRDLDTIERQWQFVYTLAVEPHLAPLVKRLHLLWLPTGDNSELLLDIARTCPNTEDILIQRGSSPQDPNQILEKDVLTMAALLNASPRAATFWYCTVLEFEYEDDRYGFPSRREEIFNVMIKDPRFAKFAAQLVHLTLHGHLQWLLQAFSPHLSSNLATLTLGQNVRLDFKRGFFTDLSRQCPHLEELDVRSSTVDAADLVEACKIWGTTLHTLRVMAVEDQFDGWISQAIYHLKALRELDLGPSCYVLLTDIDAIAASTPQPRFTSLSFDEMQTPLLEPHRDITQEQLDNSIARLIRSHASTLESLYINPNIAGMGRIVLQSCKQARRLKSLHLAPLEDTKPSDVDDLLEACPALDDLSESIGRFSSRQKEWEERNDARWDQLEKEMAPDIDCQNGLGS